jgi:carbonic anhydrase
MQVRFVLLCLGLLLGAEGCAKVKAAVCADMVPAPKPGAATEKPAGAADAPPSTETKPEGAEQPTLTSEAHNAGPAQEQFALPFAWEKSPDEPLSKTRAYLREMARDNAAYMRKGPAFFKPLVNETPRATVVSCADSHVQAGAWDGSPENDAFTVRNLGNQVDPGMGAIQYGVDSLNTPVLVILGHTGCSAIKTALTGTSKLSGPIKRELASLKIPKKLPKKLDDKFLAQVAVDNVNDQVEHALSSFTARVNSGQLTIIGAIYDVQNALGKGQGNVSIVNVNGITEAGRLKAFRDAVLAGANLDADGKKSMDPFERLSQVFADHLKSADAADEEDDDEEPAVKTVVVQPGAAPVPIKPPTPEHVAGEHAKQADKSPMLPEPATHPGNVQMHEPPAPGTIPAAAAKPEHH